MSNLTPVVGGDIESGGSVRTKINVLIDLYNKLAISDGSYNLLRVDPSFIKKATPTGEVLKDDGTWGAAGGSQTLADTLTMGNHTDNIDIISPDGGSILSVVDGIVRMRYNAHSKYGNFRVDDNGSVMDWGDGTVVAGITQSATDTTIAHNQLLKYVSPTHQFSGDFIINGSVFTIGADVINIGKSGAIINFLGAALYEYQANQYVLDKLITLNYGGAAASGVGVGFEIEENSVIVGFIKSNAARNGFSLLTPAIAFKADLNLDLLTANRDFSLPNTSGTIALIADIAAALTSYVTLTGTQTLTNKRIAPRVVSTTSAATLTFNVDTTDVHSHTLQAAALTINAPTGTPNDKEIYEITVTNNGTANTLTFNPIFVFDTLDPAPPNTINGKALMFFFQWFPNYSHYKVIGWRFV